MKNILQSTISAILGFYLITVTLAVPYYNWEYAKKNGFISWLLMGEIVPTLKAVVWPYYAFYNTTKPNTPQTAPNLSAGELSLYSKILSKSQTQKLSKEDLDTIRQVMSSYTGRTGSKIQKGQYNYLVTAMKEGYEYQYEFGTSALFSWDRKEYSTTNDFDRIFKQLQAAGTRKEKLLNKDIATLKAAAANQPFIQDEDGNKYEFSREIILSQLQAAERDKLNATQFIGVIAEFTEKD